MVAAEAPATPMAAGAPGPAGEPFREGVECKALADRNTWTMIGQPWSLQPCAPRGPADITFSNVWGPQGAQSLRFPMFRGVRTLRYAFLYRETASERSGIHFRSAKRPRGRKRYFCFVLYFEVSGPAGDSLKKGVECICKPFVTVHQHLVKSRKCPCSGAPFACSHFST